MTIIKEDKKNIAIKIRVTEEERKAMDELAEEYGITRSELIRKVVKERSESYFSQKKMLEKRDNLWAQNVGTF